MPQRLPGSSRAAVRRVIFGVLDKESLRHIADMTPREALTLLPLVVLTIFFGVYPGPLLDVFGPSVEHLMSGLQASLQSHGAVIAAGLVLAPISMVLLEAAI